MASPWLEWAPPRGSNDTQIRRLLRAISGLHSSFKDEVWVWRGQSDKRFGIEPAMHTRVRLTTGLANDERNVRWATRQLIDTARQMRFDRLNDIQLPDLALLAHLQHHGAATPLLDVTTDPFVALWMAVNAGSIEEDIDENVGDLEDPSETSALLFAIRRPDRSDHGWLDAFDAESYETIAVRCGAESGLPRVMWYRPPDVSERLRIQRGSFLLGPLVDDDRVTIPLDYETDTDWLEDRINKLNTGAVGNPGVARSRVVAFRVRGGLKRDLRRWLRLRAGLTRTVIYPTPWNRPFLDEFCTSYGRTRPVDH